LLNSGIPHDLLPPVTVNQSEETLTFADGTTITRWSRTIRDGDSPPLWMDNYLITTPGGNHHITPHTYYEKR
jgi:hypothetical protein